MVTCDACPLNDPFLNVDRTQFKCQCEWAELARTGTIAEAVQPKPPNLFQMGRTLAMAAIKATTGLIETGHLLVDEETFAARTKECEGGDGQPKCEHWDVKSKRCLKCGCYQAKRWLRTEECPLPEGEKKWLAVK